MIAVEEFAESGGLHATKYDRQECQIGLVHLGYGAFHRAHQAVYVDDYMDLSGDLRWGIAAINLRRLKRLHSNPRSPSKMDTC